jgi:hypothetical protein
LTTPAALLEAGITDPADIVECALCGLRVYFEDTYSPGDDAICATCASEVTGNDYPPPIPCLPADVSSPVLADQPAAAHRHGNDAEHSG